MTGSGNWGHRGRHGLIGGSSPTPPRGVNILRDFQHFRSDTNARVIRLRNGLEIPVYCFEDVDLGECFVLGRMEDQKLVAARIMSFQCMHEICGPSPIERNYERVPF